jgi:hypothetical protein
MKRDPYGYGLAGWRIPRCYSFLFGEGKAASCAKLGLCVSYQPNHSEKGCTVVNRWYEF